jgi:Xaa-Pro aminopeptidase
MATINQEFDRLAQSVNQTLTTHQQELQLEREQIKCLTQLLSSAQNFNLDQNCISAIQRLSELLDRHQQANDRVYNVLNTLTQAKDAKNLTIDSQGEMATALKLELDALAQRLKIEPATKLLKAIRNPTEWSNLMKAHSDSDGYQWQFPGFKGIFHDKTRLQIIGTKTVKLAPNSTNN